MRISDWSSDVCSSDLSRRSRRFRANATSTSPNRGPPTKPFSTAGSRTVSVRILYAAPSGARDTLHFLHFACNRRNRRSEERVSGKSVSVRVDLGGRRIIKKKKKYKKLHIE